MLVELFRFLHFVGLVWGVGGATVAAILSSKAEKDPSINLLKIIPPISILIWAGIFLLIISGIGMVSVLSWPLNQTVLRIKEGVVVLIIIFGIFVTLKSKEMERLVPKSGERPSPQFLKIKNQIKIISTINLLLWYLTIFLAVLL